jgi:hypothetical protein
VHDVQTEMQSRQSCNLLYVPLGHFKAMRVGDKLAGWIADESITQMLLHVARGQEPQAGGGGQQTANDYCG